MASVELELVVSKEQRNFAKHFVETYHSYVPTFNSVGRQIDWIIKVDNERCGVIGLGSATYPPCKDVLTYLNMTKNEYKDKFNNFANNWRFCLLTNEKNVGTRVLKLFRQYAPLVWKEAYGDNLEYIVTFVGGGNTGAVYKADNWICIGHTAGLPEHTSVSMKWNSSAEISNKFVKPTGDDRKLIFIHKVNSNVKVVAHKILLW